MLTNCTILCFLALVAVIVIMPTDSTDSSEKNYAKKRHSRALHDKIDGATHYIKSAGITYRQRVKNNKCLVEYEDQLLAESSVIKIRKKVFRVENCLLERVYHACGPNLLLMLSVVCRAVEQHSTSNLLTKFKRDTSSLSDSYLEWTTDRTKRVITESCCENLCSISELTRYCHQ